MREYRWIKGNVVIACTCFGHHSFLTFLMDTSVQLNVLLDDVPKEKKDTAGCYVRFQKIFRFVSRLEKSTHFADHHFLVCELDFSLFISFVFP